MYRIQKLQRLRHLLLTWTHVEDGPSYIIGDVTQGEGIEDWTLRYRIDSPDLQAAQQKGFESYPGLPMSDVPIVSGVRQTFSTRVPSPQRTDYNIFLDHWLLSRDQQLKTMDILGYTGGLIPRDTFRFVPRFELQTPFDFVTEVQGTKHWREHVAALRLGDTINLHFMSSKGLISPDPRLLSEQGHIVGAFETALGRQIKTWSATRSVICSVAQINGSSANPRLVLAVQVGF